MHPATAPLIGIKKAIAVLNESLRVSEVQDRPDLLVGIEEITELVGYALINQLENEFSLDEDLQQRYKGERADYDVRGH